MSGRHAFLVGYQPDEALRPSLAFLPLSFRSLCHPSTPFPSFFFLSRPLSKSPFRLVSLQVEPEGNGSLSTELYIYTRASLRSPELMCPWKNLGRTLLSSTNYSLYLAILTCNFLYAFDAVDTDENIAVFYKRNETVVRITSDIE